MPPPLLYNTRNRRKFLYLLTFLFLVFLVFTETAIHGSHRPVASRTSSVNSTLGIGSGKPPNILLVSAFFPLEKSKHSHKGYEKWLSNFLGTITTPVYFYAPPSLTATILEIRADRPIYINTTYSSPFDIPPLQSHKSAYEHLHTLDREASRHSPELYAVWNAKPWLLDSAVQHLRATRDKAYDYAFWIDADSFRGEYAYTQWPSPERVKEVWAEGARLSGMPMKDLLFFPLTGTYTWLMRYWLEEDGPVDAEISEGSFFGGSPDSVSWWSGVYYTYHDYYLQKGYFVGKDNTLVNSLFLLFPSRIIGVWLGDPNTRSRTPYFDSGPLGECGDSRFYYQFFMATEEDKKRMQDRWMKNLKETLGWPWRGWNWWTQRQKCGITRVLWMQNMLWNKFGRRWGVVNSIYSQ